MNSLIEEIFQILGILNLEAATSKLTEVELISGEISDVCRIDMPREQKGQNLYLLWFNFISKWLPHKFSQYAPVLSLRRSLVHCIHLLNSSVWDLRD